MLNTVRRMATFSLIMLVSLLLISCAGQAKFKPTEKAAGYDKNINGKVLVVFETSHLVKAFSEGGYLVRNQIGNTPQDAAKSVINELKSQLVAYDIAVDGEVVEVIGAADRTAIAKAVAKYPATQQILLINSDSFQTSQLMRYGAPQGPKFWSGRVSWSLAMFDRTAASTTGGKAVWSGKTEMVNFSPAQCGNDQFKLCADRFVSNIVYQLRTDGLIRKIS